MLPLLPSLPCSSLLTIMLIDDGDGVHFYCVWFHWREWSACILSTWLSSVSKAILGKTPKAPTMTKAPLHFPTQPHTWSHPVRSLVTNTVTHSDGIGQKFECGWWAEYNRLADTSTDVDDENTELVALFFQLGQIKRHAYKLYCHCLWYDVNNDAKKNIQCF